MSNEELKKALLALRDALDNVIRVMDGQAPETRSEGKRDTTVSEFWSALKDKDFVNAKRLFQKFAAMDLTEKQKELKVRMKTALIDRYNRVKTEDNLPF